MSERRKKPPIHTSECGTQSVNVADIINSEDGWTEIERLRDANLTEVAEVFSSPLDKGIEHEVKILRGAGIETFESCEGGKGHAYLEPTIRFHGERAEGFRALAVALQYGLKVSSLRRTWPVNDGEPTGPWWEIVFVPTTTK